MVQPNSLLSCIGVEEEINGDAAAGNNDEVSYIFFWKLVGHNSRDIAPQQRSKQDNGTFVPGYGVIVDKQCYGYQ